MINSNYKGRIILHIDFNAFFCSVAEIYNPALRGTAFAIGKENSNYGVLSTASYEARKYGIKSGMATSVAFKLLPSLNVVSLSYDHYLNYHKKFISLLKEYTNLIEVASIDEAYIDITEISSKRHPLIVAKEIQTRLLKMYHLPCSIGIAPTLFLAKMASDLKKPLGITVLRKRDVKDVLYPLSVKEIFGIGKKTYPRLIDNGIKTIGDFMEIENKDKIIELIGSKSYLASYEAILGNSRNHIDLERHAENESISTMQTYDRRLSNDEEILFEIHKMAKELYERLTKGNYYTKTLSLTFRNIEFKTITRSKTIEYTNDFEEIFDVLTDILDENYHGEVLRLVGVGFSNLLKENLLPKDYNLFTIPLETEKEDIIKDMIKDMQAKYGTNSLYFGKDSKKSLTSNTNSLGVEAPDTSKTDE